MKNIIIKILISIVLIFGFTQCRNTNADKSKKTTPLTTVTISQAFQHLLYIGLYVSQEKGFFAEEGLDVRIETAGGDAQAFSALTSSNADFAQGDPAFVAIANEQGWGGKVVVMAVNRVAVWGITFDPTIQPFSDPTGFRGHTVATYPNPNTSYVVQKQLALKAGLEVGRDTKILEVEMGTELASLQNGRASIAQTIEPNVSTVELEGGKVVFSYPEAWGDFAFTGLMVSDQTIKERPEMVQKVVNAYEKALNYIHTDLEGTLLVAKQYLPHLKDEVIRTALRRLIDSGCIPKHTQINMDSWSSLLQTRIDVGDLKQMPTINLIDNTFAENARQ